MKSEKIVYEDDFYIVVNIDNLDFDILEILNMKGSFVIMGWRYDIYLGKRKHYIFNILHECSTLTDAREIFYNTMKGLMCCKYVENGSFRYYKGPGIYSKEHDMPVLLDKDKENVTSVNIEYWFGFFLAYLFDKKINFIKS